MEIVFFTVRSDSYRADERSNMGSMDLCLGIGQLAWARSPGALGTVPHQSTVPADSAARCVSRDIGSDLV